MCTLTWWSSPDSGAGDYEVFFNRDEMKERPVATAPELSVRNGVRFLAPRDTAAGGTWLLVNEFGATVSLLNWYSRAALSGPVGNKRSRGQLVLELGEVKDSEALANRLAAFDPKQFQPFRLLAFFPSSQEVAIDYWQWSGLGDFERADCPPMPVCSSSFDRDPVIEQRVAALARAMADRSVPGPERLWKFHHNSGLEETTAYTVRMNRPDAQTWSISRVAVKQEAVQFVYEAESLDLAAAPEVSETTLERFSSDRA